MRTCPHCGRLGISEWSVGLRGPALSTRCRACRAYVATTLASDLTIAVIAIGALVVVGSMAALLMIRLQSRAPLLVFLVFGAIVLVAVGWYQGHHAPLKVRSAATVRRARAYALLALALLALLIFYRPRIHRGFQLARTRPVFHEHMRSHAVSARPLRIAIPR